MIQAMRDAPLLRAWLPSGLQLGQIVEQLTGFRLNRLKLPLVFEQVFNQNDTAVI